MKKKLGQILCDLINIPSYNEISREHDIISYLKGSFAPYSEEIVTITTENNNCHLLIGLNTKLKDVKDCIVLSGHIDTVKPTNEHRPLALISNGNINGLGSSDMKSFIASLIYSASILKKSKNPIVISITSDEEYDMYGICGITKEMKSRNINPSLIIIGEPTNSKFSLSNNGNAIFIDVMHGKACHTSTPELGINAINLSMRMVDEIEKIYEKFKNDCSISVTNINGGTAPNIVPDSCEIRFSVRTNSKAVFEEIKNELKNKHNQISKNDPHSSLVNLFTIPAFEYRESKYIDIVAKKNAIDFCRARFTTEAGDFQLAYPNSSIIIFGPGNPNCIHKPGENININQLHMYSQKLNSVVRDYNNLRRENNYENEILF